MARSELASLFVKMGIDAKEFKKGLKVINDDLNGASKKVKKTGDSLQTLKKVAVVSFAGWGVKELVLGLVGMAKEVDRVTRRMDAAAGGGEKTTRAWAFLREESQRLGLNLQDSVKSFSNLTAAARLSGVSLEESEKIFRGMAEAGTAMQMSQDDINGAMRAVVQIMSKGKAQAEELRGQLGERLPGAFGLAAKAMGTTTEGLSLMLDRGEVLAKDLLPKLAEVLTDTFAAAAKDAAGTVGAETNRLANAFFELKKVIIDSGVGDLLAGVIKDLAAAAKFWTDLLPEQKKAFEINRQNAEDLLFTAEQAQVQQRAVLRTMIKQGESEEELEKQSRKVLDLNIQVFKIREGIRNFGRSINAELKKEGELKRAAKKKWEETAAEVQRFNDLAEASIIISEQAEEDREKRAKFEKENRKRINKLREEENKLLLERRKILDQFRVIDKVTTENFVKNSDARATQLFHESDALQVEIDKFDRLKRLDEERTDSSIRAAQESTSAWDKFFDGMSTELDKSEGEIFDWTKKGADAMDAFSSAASSSLSDGLFKLIKGDLDSFGEIWDGFWDNMLGKFVDVVAEMAVNWAIRAGGDILSSIFLDQGAWNIKRNEQPAVLHKGEMVVPADTAGGIRENFQGLDEMNEVFGPGGSGVSTAGPGEDIVGGTGLAGIDPDIKEAAKSTAKVTGVKLAGGLLLGGGIDPASALMGSATTFIDQIIAEKTGAVSKPASVVGAIGKVAGGLFAGPIGAQLGGIAGRQIGERLGDLFNIRENETFLDALEMVTSRKDASDIVSAFEEFEKGDHGPGREGTLPGGGIFTANQSTDTIKDVIADIEALDTPDVPVSEVGFHPDLDRTFDDESVDFTEEDFEGAFNEASEGFLRQGTGMGGLENTGPFFGHKGEIVLNPEESESLRSMGSGGGGGDITVNLVVDGKVLATTVAKNSGRSSDFQKTIRDIIDRHSHV